ncbi:rRNA-processing protein utp21 [Dispira parvispora]|uniref:rRNA-processing protein utp21 n=1 Tax=Dispira parvispora TaxID=1520584 RepID=A0A9W8AWY8_9FUNG|nr:rRNA-processing protein utp21 [Dispira parvispora]
MVTSLLPIQDINPDPLHAMENSHIQDTSSEVENDTDSESQQMDSRVSLKKRRQASSTKGYVPKIFQPFRFLGYITTEAPFSVYEHSGEYRLISSLGSNIQNVVLRSGRTELLTPGLEFPITSLTGSNRETFVTSGPYVVKLHRGKQVQCSPPPINETDSGEHLGQLVYFGSVLVALSANKKLKVYYRTNMDLYTTIEFQRHSAGFEPTVLVHPTTYLNKIVVGGSNGALQIWNLKTNKLLYETAALGSAVTALVQSPVVDVLAIGLADGTIALHNIRTDKRVVTYQQEGQVTSISFRSDGEKHFMASGTMDGTIVFWDLETRRLHYLLHGAHQGPVSHLYFLPKIPILISSGHDNAIRQWKFHETSSHPLLHKELAGFSEPPHLAHFYAEGDPRLLAACPDRSLRAFNTSTMDNAVEFGQNPSLTGIKKNRKSDSTKLPKITAMASNAHKAQDWTSIVTCHQEQTTAHLWLAHNRSLARDKLIPPEKSEITAVGITNDGNYAFTGQENGNVCKFSMQSTLLQQSFRHHTNSVTGVYCNRSNSQVVTTSLDGTVAFWEFNGGEPIRVVQVGLPISHSAYHPDNGLLVIASDDLVIRVYDTTTYTMVRKFIGHTNRITSLMFSPDGRWVVSSSFDATVRTWDLPSGHLVDWFEVHNPVTSVAFSPNGHFLATTHVDQRAVTLWINKSMYSFVPLRPVTQDSPPMLDVERAVRCQGHGNDMESEVDVEGEVNDDADTTMVSYKSPEQLAEELLTLSDMPKSKWQNILNLDIIKQRNKASKEVEKPKQAPFFLQTLPGVEPRFNLDAIEKDQSSADKENKDENALDSDRLISFNSFRPETQFVRELKQGEATEIPYESFMVYMKTLSPSAVDFELRSLSLENDFEELLLFLRAMKTVLQRRRDFELIQVYLNLFFRIHGDIIVENAEAFASQLEKIQELLQSEWQRVEEMLQYSQCLIDFSRASIH